MIALFISNLKYTYSFFCNYCITVILWYDFILCRDARGNRFEQAHAFIGYQRDTPAAVVFQATNQLRKLLSDGANMSPVWQRLQRIGVLENISPERLMDDDEGCDEWKEAVRLIIWIFIVFTA